MQVKKLINNCHITPPPAPPRKQGGRQEVGRFSFIFKNLQASDRFLATTTYPKYDKSEIAINTVIHSLNQAASFTLTPPMYATAQFPLFPLKPDPQFFPREEMLKLGGKK